MSHTQIAGHVTEQLTGVVANPEWWAQSVTVAYEQHIGARRPGQTGDGRFNVSAGRTVEGTADDLLTRWAALMAGDPGVAYADPPSTSTTEKWRYWRARLADGSRVSVNITAKDAAGGAGRCTVAVAHAGLASPGDVEGWRAFWKDRLREL
jgi:hypothetical protein